VGGAIARRLLERGDAVAPAPLGGWVDNAAVFSDADLRAEPQRVASVVAFLLSEESASVE
jgi:hypothetical protein